MLLPTLERQDKSAFAIGIHCFPDNPSGNFADMLLVHGKITAMRAAEGHRQTERLRIADNNIRSQLAGRFQYPQRQRIGHHDQQCAFFFGDFFEDSQIFDRSEKIRILDNDRSGIRRRHTVRHIEIGDVLIHQHFDDIKAATFCGSVDNCAGIRMDCL